ncbi:MAG: hypothetical protein ACE5H7_07860 [Acidiferrobacterales bacterium]
MDWAKQSQELVRTWAETQHKMWDAWLQSMQAAGAGALADTWQKTLETWQQSATYTLEAQANLSKMWAESLAQVPGTPENFAQWAKQAETMIAGMNETQKQLWDSCFTAMKKADLQKTAGAWEQEGQKLFQSWQASARKAMDTQMELASKWMKP